MCKIEYDNKSYGERNRKSLRIKKSKGTSLYFNKRVNCRPQSNWNRHSFRTMVRSQLNHCIKQGRDAMTNYMEPSVCRDGQRQNYTHTALNTKIWSNSTN